MARSSQLLLGLAIAATATQVSAQVRFYEHDNFRGRSFTAERSVGDFSHFGFNDKASSAIVRGGRWELCNDVRFGGHCIVLALGRYPSLSAMAMNDRVSSARRARPSGRSPDRR